MLVRTFGGCQLNVSPSCVDVVRVVHRLVDWLCIALLLSIDCSLNYLCRPDGLACRANLVLVVCISYLLVLRVGRGVRTNRMTSKTLIEGHVHAILHLLLRLMRQLRLIPHVLALVEPLSGHSHLL